ncbi:hypothetical protein AB0D11_23360 [Streptomyces monashensis]|uniref:hypothetical protein n=1 Tax=Streptomyces monashensis TaxID=1678012 RepID=UPI0033DC0B17
MAHWYPQTAALPLVAPAGQESVLTTLDADALSALQACHAGELGAGEREQWFAAYGTPQWPAARTAALTSVEQHVAERIVALLGWVGDVRIVQRGDGTGARIVHGAEVWWSASPWTRPRALPWRARKESGSDFAEFDQQIVIRPTCVDPQLTCVRMAWTIGSTCAQCRNLGSRWVDYQIDRAGTGAL